MPPLTAQQSKQARREAKGAMSEEGWLGNPKSMRAWPSRNHGGLGLVRTVPPEVMVFESSIPDNEVDARMLAGIAGNDNTGNDAQRAVGRGHMQDNAASSRVIGQNQVLAGHLGLNITGGATDGGPPQGQKGVRTISEGLGGQTLAASSGNHSHGSGNTMDFDYLREDQKRRVLAQRLLLGRDLKRREGDVTREEVNRLQSLVLTLLHILTDAPDLDAFHRERLRKAGVPFLEFFEYRQHERYGDHGPRHYQGSKRQKRGIGWLHDRSQKHYREPHADLEA